MRNIILDFIKDDSGAAAAEYVLILAVIGGAVGTGAILLGGAISTALSKSSSKIAACSAVGATTC